MNATSSLLKTDLQDSDATIRRRRLRVFWSLTLLCVLAYAQPIAGLFSGTWPYTEDAPGLFGMWREFSREALRGGTLPMWNPHLFCGLPFMSNGQTSILYPPNILYWLLPLLPALVLDAILHNIALALGGYCLARALGLSRTAAWVSAVALGLGGAVSAHIYTGHMTWHAARVYIPWELLALLLYLRSGQLRYVIGLAVLLALQMASGYPPFVLLGTGLCCGLLIAWCASRGWRRRTAVPEKPAPPRPILPRGWPQAVLLTALLTATLSAVIVLPLREVGNLTAHGSGLPYRVATTLSGSWRTLARLALPDFFGGNRDAQWSSEYSAHEEAAYIGVLTLVLAVGAPFLARRRRRTADGGFQIADLPAAVPWLWALLPVSAVLAMGDNTPLYRWLYDHCVLFRMTRVPVRWLEVWYLCGALLAGFAFDATIHRRRDTSAAKQKSILAPALWTICALCLIVGIGALLTAPQAPLWLETAQWNIWLKPGQEPRTLAAKLERAGELRQAAIMQSLLTFMLANVLALLVMKWQMAATPRARQRVELLLLLLLATDVLLLFWRSARPVTQRQVNRQLNWPPQLARAYRAGARWDTGVPWLAINQAIPRHIDLFNGYDALGGNRYFQFVSAVVGKAYWIDCYQPEYRNSLLRVASLTHTLSVIQDPIGPIARHDPALQFDIAARSGRWKLWQVRYAVGTGSTQRWESAWPRAYITRSLTAVAEPQQLQTLKRLALLPFESSGRPAVAAPNAFPGFSPKPKTALTTRDKIVRRQRRLNQTTTQITTTAPTVFVEGETLYPGWRAWVNGQPAPLQPVNFLFRGVGVPAGKSYVQTVYDNQTYRFALFVSLCGLAALAAMLAPRLLQLSAAARQPAERGSGGDEPRGIEPR